MAGRKNSNTGIAAAVAGNACKIAFLLSFALGYFIVPSQVTREYLPLAIAFYFTFSYSMACAAYAVRENVKRAHAHGLLSAAASVFGFAALSACGLTLSCGAGVAGLLLSLFPAAIVGYFEQWGAQIVAASIALHLYSVWGMGCLRMRTFLKIAAS